MDWLTYEEIIEQLHRIASGDNDNSIETLPGTLIGLSVDASRLLQKKLYPKNYK